MTRDHGFGDEVKRRIMVGTFVLSAGYADAFYRQATKVRRLIREEYEEVFKQVDVIIGPTSPSVAWKVGEKVDDPVKMYLSDIYTVSANLAGIPALSVPCGSVQDLPVGVQLQGRWFEEGVLLQVGKWIEKQI
jgi:aspartyl-tRNA(Asn)/glutamyl-tRNA(Gln) amidotransferase subunit A